MDDRGKLSGCGGAQIDDLPSCLMMDILLRLPIEALTRSRLVCRSWFLLFSDPMFVRLHSARSPACLLRWRSGDLKCYTSVGGKDSEIDIKFRLPDSIFRLVNSCQGLLCSQTGRSDHEIYVCNPILVQGAISSKFYRFIMAEIYTISDGTRQWKSIGITPSNAFNFPGDSPLNGSIHWADGETHQIAHFDFESEQFRSFPAPPPFCNGRWSLFRKVSVCLLDGCLCIYAFGYDYGDDGSSEILEKWVMKEYGVQESWTALFSTQNNLRLNLSHKYYAGNGFPNRREAFTYNPSFISLQDLARSEDVTVLSRTRFEDEKQAGVKYEVSEEKARTLGVNKEVSVKDTIESFKEMGVLDV